MGQLAEELRAVREQMKAIAEKSARDAAEQKAEHAQVVASLKQAHASYEARRASYQQTMELKVDRQSALMNIWREIIADLRIRLQFLQMWVWGFRRWHYNVQEIQLEALQAHQEALD